MDDDRQTRLTRRGFLAGTIAAALAACSDGGESSETSSPPGTTGATTVPPASPPTTLPPPTTVAATSTTVAATSTIATPPTTATSASSVTSNPFALGVSSGDPLADSVILWTRLLPTEPLPATDIDVNWEIATDTEMANIVATGSAIAVAALGHSVHVDATGLDADTEYYYRFRVGEFETNPARTHTFAAAGTTPEHFRFAFSSCQNWEQGYYTAYRDLVEQGNIDAFVFLGDYIYEYASGDYSDARGRTTDQNFECETVEQYRQRYALYQTDPLLQAAHALVPWIITWDDHEVDNDYAAAISEDNAIREEFLARRAAGYQAWYEHMPVRLDPPSGPDYPIYRSFAHGDLLRFHVLDTRQYRADQQRGDQLLPALGDAVQFRDNELAFSPEQTMLGNEQHQWLVDGVGASEAIWDVLAQQVFMFGGNAVQGADPPVVVVDTWDGYAGARQTLLEAIGPVADNLIVLTGDFHSAAVADLRADPFDLTKPIVGSEFMGSSISSSFFDDDQIVTDLVTATLAANPQLKWLNTQRGYTLCDVTPGRWRATYRAVTDQFDEASPVETVSEWEVTAGTPGVIELA